MKLVIWIAATCMALSLTACEQTDQYPVSGEECGPNDPVKTLDANDCFVPAPVGI